MSMLQLAIQAKLPLIHISTDDVLNVEQVLGFLSQEKVQAVAVPEQIGKVGDLKLPDDCHVFMTSVECASLPKLYRMAVDREVSFVFVNTQQHVLMFDGGPLYPPQEMVAQFLRDTEILESEDEVTALLPCFGGLTLKDVSEVTKLTMTRDQSLTPKGVNETRRGYAGKLRGIDQVDIEDEFYEAPQQLKKWVAENKTFFLTPPHPSLMPRGVEFDGPPGTGKTMGAKFIAREFNVPLYRLDLGAMMGKYVGESEGNLTAALAQIDKVEPAVLLLDEVEKIFSSGSDGNVSTRMLSQLLWWLQERKTKVFVVMTTNKSEAIPDELHRPGRIDSIMTFNGLPSMVDGKKFALKALETMSSQIGYSPTKANLKTLDSRIGILFADSTAVPQAQVAEEVKKCVREFATEGVM